MVIAELCFIAGADRDAKDIEGLTPFDSAQELEIKELVAVGNNLLYVAIAKGDIKTVSCYVEEHGLALDVTFATGLSPLHVACFHGSLEVVQFLLRHSADVNYQVFVIIFKLT